LYWSEHFVNRHLFFLPILTPSHVITGTFKFRFESIEPKLKMILFSSFISDQQKYNFQTKAQNYFKKIFCLPLLFHFHFATDSSIGSSSIVQSDIISRQTLRNFFRRHCAFETRYLLFPEYLSNTYRPKSTS
jgi:hypothetical protein